MVSINLDIVGCFKFFEEEIRFGTFPKKNKKKLERDMEDLKRIRRDVTTIFQEQERTRPGTECKVVVNSWLNAVNDIDIEVNTLLDELKKTISCTCFCSPRHNYLLGKEVVRLIDRVHKLVEERTKFDDDNLVRLIPPVAINNVPDQSTTMVGMDGKSSEIQGYFSDSEVKTIGIWGRGGIGKTTLMLKSIKQWLSGNDHDFRYIIWIEMSQNDDDILEIQKRIARCISLSLPSEHDKWDNARMLTNALQSRKSLVLIDNVWETPAFDKIGIPFAVGTTVVKILFTTRSEGVCNDMKAQKIVHLDSLDEKESLQLFEGNISPDMILRQRVDEILRRCGGLPLLIVKVARTVANRTRDEEWDHAVESLRMYGSQITGEEIEGGCFRFFEEEIRFSTCPKKNKENLEKEMEHLKRIQRDVTTKIREQLRTGGTECKDKVKSWLDAVDGIETKVNTLLDELKKTISCTCCFPCRNYFLGKGVVPLIERVHELVEERGSFDDDNLVRSIPPDPIDNVPDQSITMVGRDGKSSEIHGYLRDSHVTTIGIWGRGGIGKTTMLKSIKQWLSGNDHDFHYIIWIEMSQNEDNILKIQERIAKCIFLSLPSVHDEWDNARTLANALQSKKSLLLMDNVWKKLDFERIGIPFVKILFTTRSQEVCTDMRAQKFVCLDSLDEKESLQLFQANIRNDVVDLTDKIVRQRVEEILKICGGLPLVIVTVARTVANYTRVEEWDHAVDCLRSSREEIKGMDEVMKCLKFSYDKLEDDKIKSCLLYLSLYPEVEHFRTDLIIKEWVAEGFLDTPNDNSFTRSYRRGVVNINKLKSICLVEDTGGYWDNWLKLHDEIRRMLCWIRKHENEEVFIVYNDEISDCNYDRWDLAKGIFLLEGQVKRLPETGIPLCPNLTSLLVHISHSGNRIDKLPTEDFFHFTPSLQVLDLCFTGLVDIPKSIGELVELRYLNLYGTNIRTLPMELANLKKLKCLDLGNTSELETIVGSSISQLSALQWLDLFDTSYKWKSDDVNMTTQHPLLKLEDLRELKNLEDLGVDVRSNSHLDTILCDNMLLKSIRRISFVQIDFTTIDLGVLQPIEWISQRLPELKELVVDECALSTDILEIKDDQLPLVTQLYLKTLAISSVTLNDASRPFSRLKNVQIYHCHGLKEVSWTARIPSLEFLTVYNCNSVRELVEEIREERDYFPKLQDLEIRDLENLERIHGRSPLLFPALRSLHIVGCPKLKHLSLGDDSAKNMESIIFEDTHWDLLEWENDQIRAKFLPYVHE